MKMPVINELKKHIPKIATITLVVVALLFAWLLYGRYRARPWTRDGQVRANTVKIAPRVSGYLVEIGVKDNQFVRKGERLFQIDPSSYQLAVDQAQVDLDQAREDVAALEAAVRSAEAVVQQRNAAVTSAQSKIDEARAGVESADAAVREAEAGVTSAGARIAQVMAQLEEAKPQVMAQLEEAKREAARAQRLAEAKAGAVETAEAKAAAVEAYRAELDNANAGLKQSQAALEKSKAARSQAQAQLVAAQNGLVEAQAAVASAVAERDKAQANLGEPGEANVRIRSAKVQLEQAKLNLEWTSIDAPADGYVSNMNLLEDTFVSAGTPFALFVDAASFRVDAYFQETKLKNIQPGDRAVITLMGHGDRRLEGEVESIGYAINPPNLANTEGPENLVPTIEPTFEWIRLAQRVPVRIRLKEIPDDLHLVSGTTASISIQK
jgi:multidrug resistance efflux pump